jgi:DNA-directed RNA polymerase subunit RPC12/RpoP
MTNRSYSCGNCGHRAIVSDMDDWATVYQCSKCGYKVLFNASAA